MTKSNYAVSIAKIAEVKSALINIAKKLKIVGTEKGVSLQNDEDIATLSNAILQKFNLIK